MKIEYWILIAGAIIILSGFAVTASSAGNIFTESENGLQVILSEELPALSSISVPLQLLAGEEFDLSITGYPSDTMLNLQINGPEGTLLDEGIFSDRIITPLTATTNGEYEIIIANFAEKPVMVIALLTTPGFVEEHDIIMPLIGSAVTGAILSGIGFVVLIAGIVMLLVFRVKRPKILK